MLYFSTVPYYCICYLAKEETGNCIFSLKYCMLLCQQTNKRHWNYYLVTVEILLINSRNDRMSSPHWTKKGSRLFWTLSTWVFLRRASIESQLNVWMGYPTISKNVRRFQIHRRWPFCLSAGVCTGATCEHAVQLMLKGNASSSVLVSYSPNSPELNSTS